MSGSSKKKKNVDAYAWVNAKTRERFHVFDSHQDIQKIGEKGQRGKKKKKKGTGKKKKELYYAVEEGGEQDEFMLNAPMKQPSGPNESNRRCINTPGEANTRIHTHTSTDNSNKLSVRFLCCWLRPKMRYYKKMGKTLFGGLFLTAHAAHVNKKTSASYPAAQSSLHFVSQTFPFVVSFFFFFFAGACIRNHDTFPYD